MANSKTPNQVKPPALPLATREYSRQYQDQLNSVLRLFFTNLDSAINAILSPDSGGAAFYKPYGMFFSTVTQTALAVNTPQDIEFQDTLVNSGVELTGANNENINITYQGVYNFQVTLQIRSTNNSAKDITVSAKLNGTAVPNSAQKVTIVKTGFDQVAYSFNILCTADSIINIDFEVTDTAVLLESVAAGGPTRPAVPSAAVSVTFISNAAV